MKRLGVYLFHLLLIASLLASYPLNVNGQSSDEIQKKIIEYESKIKDLQSQQKTLSAQIQNYNDQINLSQLRIDQANKNLEELAKEIAILSGRIDSIRGSLDDLEVQLSQRIVDTYIKGRFGVFDLLLSANGFSGFLNEYTYLKSLQENDKKILSQLQLTRASYTNQKDALKQKKEEEEQTKIKLESFKVTLGKQKAEKTALLAVTRNDEARYQSLLAQARAEQAITSGLGTTTFLRNVGEGDSIGSVIYGSSGCSTGTHLHFSTYKGGSVEDPSNYLSPKSFDYSYGPEQYGYFGTINPHGSMRWPLDDPITINQGYGGSHAYAQQFYSTKFHDGIDIESDNLTVKAIKSGKLYGGSYKCTNGTLSYAKVEHDDGLVTWYLHMYPR